MVINHLLTGMILQVGAIPWFLVTMTRVVQDQMVHVSLDSGQPRFWSRIRIDNMLQYFVFFPSHQEKQL